MPTTKQTTLAILTLTLLAIAALGFAQPTRKVLHTDPPIAVSDTHVVFVVRHADTDPKAGNNPDLTANGYLRAEHLSEVLQDEQLGGIFVTNTARSMQTAAPAADASGIAPTIYPPMDANGLANTINGLDTNATLVIAHSNTVPMIIAALGGPSLPDLEHDHFDHLYAVVLKNGHHVRTIKLRY